MDQRGPGDDPLDPTIVRTVAVCEARLRSSVGSKRRARFCWLLLARDILCRHLIGKMQLQYFGPRDRVRAVLEKVIASGNRDSSDVEKRPF
jgi:hypothetical protein